MNTPTWLWLAAVLAVVLGAVAYRWHAQNRELNRHVAPKPHAVAQAPPATLRVLSHNVWGHYFVGGKQMRARLRAFAARVRSEGFDVVCLQELFTLSLPFATEMALFLEVAREMHAAGLVHMVDPRLAQPWMAQNHGLAIFSRYPLEAVSAFAFSATAEPLNAKGVACATVVLPCGTRVHVANFHPDSRNARTKRLQYLEAAELHGQHIFKATGTPPSNSSVEGGAAGAAAANVILLGDTNVCSRRDAEAYAEMAAAAAEAAGAPVDLFPGHSADAPATCVDHKDGSLWWIDHMFVSRALAARVVDARIVRWTMPDGTPVSDHFGLVAEFRLRD